jgi:hypothetical protein
MHAYYCAACQMPASVKDGAVVRTCNHTKAPVVAPRTATLYGEGGTSIPGAPMAGWLAALLGLVRR